VLGTYMHGLLYNDDFRQAFLRFLRRRWDLPDSNGDAVIGKTEQYDKLAELVRQNLDIPRIYRIMGEQV